MNKSEWVRGLSKIGVTGFTNNNLLELFEDYDTQQKGWINYKELAANLFNQKGSIVTNTNNNYNGSGSGGTNQNQINVNNLEQRKLNDIKDVSSKSNYVNSIEYIIH